MANPTLPFDIITNILTRLPSKTLTRFKSVSKLFYSLINSPNFINLHLTQTLTLTPNLIISQFSLFSAAVPDENNPNLRFLELNHPLKHLCPNTPPRILGSVNGVVCISMYDGSSIVLYNPSTKSHRFVPGFNPSRKLDPDVAVNVDSHAVVFGFWFDSVSGDYKVARLIEARMSILLVYHEASVYSLRTDSWKSVDDQTMRSDLTECVDSEEAMMGKFSLLQGKGVVVNEVLHFLVVVSKNFLPKVKCFSLQSEDFSILDVPEYDDKSVIRIYYIQELGGCLSVIVDCKKFDFSFVQADLWVMKEYGNKESWSLLFSICDSANLKVSTQVRPIMYSRDKERVLLVLDGLYFGWYSWGSKSFERIIVHGGGSSPNANAPYEAWTFVDSLVSVGKDTDKSKPKVVPKKNKRKDDFLSSGFKLRL